MTDVFDLVVAGAGPAGIAAATIAAERGMRVAILDDNPAPGGQIWRGAAAGQNGTRLSTTWFQRGEACPSLTRFYSCSIFDAPANGVLAAERHGTRLEFNFRHLLVATGARERFLPFPGWTLPNVMGAGALQIMVKSGLPVERKRVVIAGSGPLLLAVANYLRAHGAEIAVLCEQAPRSAMARFVLSLWMTPAKLAEGALLAWQTLGIPLRFGCWPVAAYGNQRLESVRLTDGKSQWEVACDYLACGFHLVPNLELPMLLGCDIRDGAVVVDTLQRTSVQDIFCAGEATGVGGVELALLEGQIAGLAIAGNTPAALSLARHRGRLGFFARAMEKSFALRGELRSLADAGTIVCRCEDVDYGSIAEHSSWRSAKLHTRCGMGPCQGRICGAALDFVKGWRQDSVRPPLVPVSLSCLLDEAQHLIPNYSEDQRTP